MIQVCDPPRTRQVRRLSTEEFCQLVRGEVSCVYRPRSEVLRMLTAGEAWGTSGAALLVLPEALLARDDNDPDLSVKSAQPLDGAFLQPLLAESRRNSLTTVLTLHVPSGEGRATNTLVVLREGAVIAHYHKLHLYDAFAMQESRRVSRSRR